MILDIRWYFNICLDIRWYSINSFVHSGCQYGILDISWDSCCCFLFFVFFVARLFSPSFSCLISFIAYTLRTIKSYHQIKMNSNKVIENMDSVKETFVAPKDDSSRGSRMTLSVVTGEIVRTVGSTVGAVGAAAMNFNMTLPFR
jgi:hypothetical protein